MSKWHINNANEISKCHAEKKKCPFGDSKHHYKSKAEAAYFIEKKLTKNNTLLPKLKKELQKDNSPTIVDEVLIPITDSSFLRKVIKKLPIGEPVLLQQQEHNGETFFKISKEDTKSEDLVSQVFSETSNDNSHYQRFQKIDKLLTNILMLGNKITVTRIRNKDGGVQDSFIIKYLPVKSYYSEDNNIHDFLSRLKEPLDLSKITKVGEHFGTNKPVGGLWFSPRYKSNIMRVGEDDAGTAWDSHEMYDCSDKIDKKAHYVKMSSESLINNSVSIFKIDNTSNLLWLTSNYSKPISYGFVNEELEIDWVKFSKDFDGVHVSQSAIDNNKFFGENKIKGLNYWDIETLWVKNLDNYDVESFNND